MLYRNKVVDVQNESCYFEAPLFQVGPVKQKDNFYHKTFVRYTRLFPHLPIKRLN